MKYPSETVLLDSCCRMFRQTPGTNSGRHEAEGLVPLNKRRMHEKTSRSDDCMTKGSNVKWEGAISRQRHDDRDQGC